jgi:hypothetical protein
LVFVGQWASADTIAMIGTGNVGSSLGQRFAELGHTIVYGSREPARSDVQALVEATAGDARAATPDAAVEAADIVVLAVPAEAIESVARQLGDLSGRIVIDPTNPRAIADDGLRDFPFHDSNAERVQAIAPGASVVKAFSTLGANTMLDPSLARGPVSIPMAGDDTEAKAVVAELASGIGFHPVDVGPLRYAHVLEGLHYLRFNAGQFDGARVNFYFPPDLADDD